MKRYLTSILLFCTGLLILNLGGLAYLDKIYYRDYRVVDLGFDAYLFADSHAYYLQDSTEACGVHNFSFMADSYYDMHRKLKYLIRHTEVKRIYMGVPDYGLTNYREQMNNLHRSAHFQTFRTADNRLVFLKERYFKRYIVFLNPSVGKLILFKLKKSFLGMIRSGEVGPEPEWGTLSRESRLELSEARAREQYADTRTSASLLKELEGMAELCKSRDIELVGIRFPQSADYLEQVNFSSHDTDSLFRAKGFRIYDYKDLYVGQDELFRDMDHLNQEGCRVFLELLGEEVF